MLTKLDIIAYKSIEKQSFELKPLTLLTGTNSSGKSSVIQSILLALSVNSHKNQPYLDKLVLPYTDYEAVHCRWSASRDVMIGLSSAAGDEGWFSLQQEGSKFESFESGKYLYEQSLFYLSSNRLGQEEISRLDKNIISGEQGEYLFGTFERKKDKPICSELIHPDAYTPNLKAQLAYWLSKILDQLIELESIEIASHSVKNTFKLDEIGEVSPINLGSGSSYLAKLLILGLTAKPGYLLLIENPEIHLHPKAQSQLAAFFTYLAGKGVQLVLETHSEHFLNSVRYQVYSNQILSDKVNIYYKPSIRQPFLPFNISSSGHYLNSKNEIDDFPAGFFDASLIQLLEMG